MLAELFAKIAINDIPIARRYAVEWRGLNGRVGTRLWLHAMRHEVVFHPDDAMRELASLPDKDFWATRREVALVLKDRAAAADPAIVGIVEARILNEAELYFGRYRISEGEADWRDHARDQAVWVRLTMLEQAGALSETGISELNAIRTRRDYLNRSPDDRDFFGTYMSGVRSIVGDPSPLLKAQNDDRLMLALEAIESSDPDTQQGWGAYCRIDPAGALDTLSRAPLSPANARLWNDLLYALSMGNEQDRSARTAIGKLAFDTLLQADDYFIRSVINAVTTLFSSESYQEDEALSGWWMKLFKISLQNETHKEFSRDLEFDAINSSSGRLIHAALKEISLYKSSNKDIPSRLQEKMIVAAEVEGQGGVYCRVLMVREAAFVLSVDKGASREPLTSALTADDLQGAALRAALVNSATFSALVARTFRDQILRGVTEMGEESHSSLNAAAKILAPTMNVVLGHQALDESGISAADAASALRKGPPSLRRAAADCLSRWVAEIPGSPADNWEQAIEPTFLKVWPKELRLRDRALSRPFATLAVRTGGKFPKALERLRPYMSPLTANSSLYELEESQVPEQWPSETLTMLWLLCGSASTGAFFELPEIVKRIVTADPTLEVDRRLQWLQQHKFLYG